MNTMTPKSAPSKRITLADVAREAGVSVQTASHVMADNRTVRLPESTRQRVRAAAEKVGYRANRLAQAMKRGKTQVIGVWIPVDRPVLAYMHFLHAINSHARDSGYDLMIIGLDAKMAYSAEGRMPHLWPVDGVLAVDAGKAVSAFRADPRNDDTPIAVLGLEQYVNSDSVAWDVAGAAKEATNRLIAKGCRTIAHVTMDWVLENYPREQRRRGYTEAMSEAGLEPLFVPVHGESSANAKQGVLDFLKRNPRPDAIFAFTDALAVGAARAILESGANIPTDCLIWGFSNSPEAEDFQVPLSSIRTPIPEAVDQAWTWLVERISNPALDNRLTIMPMELMERASTAT